jgi:asparagine synthase (glutamine-hydrolysing)
MCGILGWIGTGATREAFEARLDQLRHRGPDGSGLWQDRPRDVLLGHRRLSIIDLSPTGAQPMVDASGRWVIVFNGEIYNFVELRAELEAEGVAFRGRSDTEVLLGAYQRWGEGCLARLNGMFAFAIYDSGSSDASPSLFLARDRVGKKPLYYVRQGTCLRFASELKALGHDSGLDLAALNHYLAYGCYPGELCFQQGVAKLPAGHAARFTLATGQWRQWAWWTLPERAAPSAGDPEALTEELAALLSDSVRRRLVADVPVGVFLSGGLDSSLVAAAAARVSNAPVKTFTIRVPAAGFDESPYARLVATHFGTDHHELTADRASLAVLDDMAAFLDEPLADSSLIPTFLVSRMTRQHVTVALGGDGGDELFAGYNHYRAAIRDSRRWGWLPRSLWMAAAAGAARLPVGLKGRNLLVSLREGPLFQRVWGTAFFDRAARGQLFAAEARTALGDDLLAPERCARALLSPTLDPIQALCRFDFSTTLVDDYMVKVDRASMMNSLEVRAPFLDANLIDFAFTKIPSVWKCDGRETRRIERRLARKWLPPALDIDRKQGFSVPLDAWFRQAGPEAVRERLADLPEAIDRKMVEAQIQGHMAGRANGARLFALVMLSACCRRLAKRNVSLRPPRIYPPPRA